MFEYLPIKDRLTTLVKTIQSTPILDKRFGRTDYPTIVAMANDEKTFNAIIYMDALHRTQTSSIADSFINESIEGIVRYLITLNEKNRKMCKDLARQYKVHLDWLFCEHHALSNTYKLTNERSMVYGVSSDHIGRGGGWY